MLKNVQLRLPLLLKIPRFNVKLVIFLTLVLLTLDFLSIYHAFAGNPNWYNTVDFSAYLNSGKAIYEGHDPYYILNQPANLFWGSREVHDGYAYPPLLAELLGGAALLTGDDFLRYTWLGLNLIVIVASFGLLLRGFGFQLSWPWIGLSLAIFLSLGMVRNDLYHGQVNFILLYLVIVGAWFYTRGEKRLTGIFWGLLFVIKPFLGILLLWLLWRREWRTICWVVATSAGLFIISFVPLVFSLGFRGIQSWLELQSYFSGPVYSSRPDNLSISGLLLRLDSVNPFTIPWFNNQWLSLGLRVPILIFLLIGLFKGLGKPFQSIRSNELGVLLESSLVLATAMTYGPLTEGDHLLLLLPGLVAILVMTLTTFRLNSRNKSIWASLAVLWAMFFLFISLPLNIRLGVPSEPNWTPQHGLAILGTGTYALLLLGATGWLSVALHKERQGLKQKTANATSEDNLLLLSSH